MMLKGVKEKERAGGSYKVEDLRQHKSAALGSMAHGPPPKAKIRHNLGMEIYDEQRSNPLRCNPNTGKQLHEGVKSVQATSVGASLQLAVSESSRVA